MIRATPGRHPGARQTLRDRMPVCRIDLNRSISSDLGERPGMARQDRRAQRHRLRHRKTEPLGQRRHQQAPRVTDQRQKRGPGQPRQAHDPPYAQAGICSDACQPSGPATTSGYGVALDCHASITRRRLFRRSTVPTHSQ